MADELGARHSRAAGPRDDPAGSIRCRHGRSPVPWQRLECISVAGLRPSGPFRLRRNLRVLLMIQFPLFESLNVQGYGLYPGTEVTPGLQAMFQPGTTLVMGANGLGKSTLVLMLYRMCTGPTELTGSSSAELGYSQLSTVALSWKDALTFGARVNDQAADATATLTFAVGQSRISLTRSLRNLQLMHLEVDGVELEASEDDYQRKVTEAAGLDSFIDWILIQRYLTFYGDDRRSLVWDRTAQRQLLRLLFLPPKESGRWLALEREFLRQATQYRNYRAILSREEGKLTREEGKLAQAPKISAEIEGLTMRAEAIEAELDALGSRVEEAESDQRTAQLGALRAAEDRERAYRRLEFTRLKEIEFAFPSASATAAYLLGQILSGDVCPACGNRVDHFAEELRRRLASNECVVCGTTVATMTAPSEPGVVDEAEQQLSASDVRLAELERIRDEANEQHAVLLAQVRTLEAEKAGIETQLVRLHANLPDADRKVRDLRASTTAMRATTEEMRIDLDQAQREYKEYVAIRLRTIGERKDDVKRYFSKFAKEFLVESCELTWDSYKAPIGQISEPTEFYVFEVDMTGGALKSATRRERPQDVSESQREFIDLAFRMALISVAGGSHQGSLVIDTPESSLDAVFAPRAARVLAGFGVEAPDNRLIVTSNLIDGTLIPTLLGLAGITERDDSRIVDLIGLAEPTAAVRENRTAYDEAVANIFERVAQESL